MKTFRVVMCLVVFLVMSVMLFGCGGGACEQENAELKKTVDTQQMEIEKFKNSEEVMTLFILETSSKLSKCEHQLNKIEREARRSREVKKVTGRRTGRGRNRQLKNALKAKTPDVNQSKPELTGTIDINK